MPVDGTDLVDGASRQCKTNCSGSKATQRHRDIWRKDEEEIYFTYGRTHNTEARWRNWVGSPKHHNGSGDIVAEMKKQKPARPGEGLPGCRQACRLSRVSRPFRTLREGTVGGLATFAGAWKHARPLGGARDVPHVQRVRARLARGGGGSGWTLHVSDGRAG